ncbi:MAG TPA: TonB-dependent receptor plug domain-containing protein [Opitutaceae bacterium]|jgi:iron complex outermembrane receptor protein|nr:TonB-dependent receptor plug domain-containing protein [Opitutaceae bacterium]
MKKNTLRASITLLPLLAFAVPGHGQSTPSATSAADPNNPATEQVVALPEFSVSSQKGDAYRANDTLSLARIRGQLIDTPVSVNVVPRELLDDLGANSAYDATRYFAGVSNGRGAGTAGGINDRQNFRGFESQTRTVDNFSSTFIPGTSTSIDTFEPAFIERLEVVLGPDAILNPTGTPGGSINVITKSPLFTQQGFVQADVGNYSAQKLTIDTTGPIPLGDGKHLAYRVIATGQNTDTYIPGRWKKYDVAAELTYRFSPTAEITFKYFGVDYAAYGNASAPNDNGWLIYSPTSIGGATLPNKPNTAGVTYNGTNGVDTNSLTTERTNTAQLVYTGTLFDKVSMRLGGQFMEHNNVGDSAFPNLGTTETFDQNTGQVTGISSPFNPHAVPEVWRYNKSMGLMYQVENDYAANFHPGPVSLQPVAGWSIQHAYNPLGRTGTANLPNADLFAGDYSAPRPDINLFTFGNRSKSEATQKQLYALNKAGFYDDHVFIVGGVTREWVASQNYSFLPSNIITPASVATLSGFKDSYIGSALFKPVNHLALYYTFSTNASLTSFAPSAGVAAVPLWSQGRQHEFGFKSEFLDQRLSFTAAHFQMSQTNVTSPNPLFNIDPVHQPGSILTNNTSRGYEFNLVGGVTRNLSVIASYTRMKFRDAFGRRVRNVPDQMANLLANYRFTDGALKNFSVFGAVEEMGQTAGESQTGFNSNGVTRQVGFYIARWTVFNAGAAYTIGRYKFNLNVDNVLNSKFAWEPASRLSVSPYPGITVRLSTTVKF